MMSGIFHLLTGKISRNALSMLMGSIMLAFVLCFLWLSHWFKNVTAPDLTIREVSTLAMPPPPPPPPRPQEVVQQTVLSVEVKGQGAMMQNIDVTPPPLDEFHPPEMHITDMNSEWQSLDVEWEILDVESLDSLPTLLTSVRVIFPKSLIRQGVSQVLVKLDVLIDETGQVNLIAVANNPYPELDAALRKLARSSRFTPPQKDQQPARARFIWPIKIKA